MKQAFRESFTWRTISRLVAWTGSGVLAPIFSSHAAERELLSSVAFTSPISEAAT